MAKFQRGVWTRFKDTFAGGGPNLPEGIGKVVVIEAPEELAKAIFRERFKSNPDAGCKCCGDSFDIWEVDGPDEDDKPHILRANDGWL